MLKIFFTAIVLALVSLLPMASASSMELPDQDKLLIEQAVDKVLIRYHTTLNRDRILTLITRIDNFSMVARLTHKTAYMLTYLRDSLIDLLQPVTITTSNILQSPLYQTNNAQFVNPSIYNISYMHGPKTVLAGTESQIVAKYELNALYEDMLIKDFTMSSPNNLDNVIESIQIYNAYGTKIAQASPVGNQVFFNNQDILLKQGNHNRYMTVTPRKVGYNQSTLSNIVYQIQFQITRAEGMTSTDQVVVTTTNQFSDTITIRPYLFTIAELTKSRNGNTTDTVLNNGMTRLGILRLGINTSSNSTSNNQALKVILSEISLSLGNNIAGSINSISLRNSNGGTTINGIINNGKVIFSLGGMPSNERTLESLSEQGFLITVDATLSPSVSESINLSMDTNSITFTTNEDNTLYSDLGFGGGFSSSVSTRE